jgi:membrane protease YdiL (CAAX protease family)
VIDPITPSTPEAYANIPHEIVSPEIGPNSPPWGLLSAVALWIASVVLMLFMPAIFVLPYIQQQGVPFESLAEFVSNDKTAIFLQILSIIPTHLITLALAWAIVTRLGKYPFFAMLGWKWDSTFNFWRSAGLALLLFIVGMGIILAWGGPETQLDKIIKSSRATAFIAALMATATAPLVEEIIYRGLLYSAIQKLLGAKAAVAIVFALFALVHVPQYLSNVAVILTISLLSLVLTLVRAKTGKLLPCFVIHLIFNGVQAVLIVLDPYLRQHLPQSLQGEGSFIAPLVSLISSLIG